MRLIRTALYTYGISLHKECKDPSVLTNAKFSNLKAIVRFPFALVNPCHLIHMALYFKIYTIQADYQYVCDHAALCLKQIRQTDAVY